MLPLAISSSKDIDFLSALQYSPIQAYNSVGFSTALHNSTGNIYLYGWSGYPSPSVGGPNHIIAKYNKNGILQWQKNYGSSDYGFKSEFCVDTNENIYISDVFSYVGFSGKIHTIMKIDQSGSIVWAKVFYENSSYNANPTATTTSADGSYVYTAGNYGNYSYYVKYDSSGQLVAQRKLLATTAIKNSHMCVDSSNNVYIVVGEASGMTLAKYSSADSLLWQRKISSLIPYDITCDSSGNPHIAAYRYDPDPGDSSVALNGEGHIVKYNSSGQLQWQKKINLTPQGDYDTSFFTGVRVGLDGSVYANLVITDYFFYPPSPTQSLIGNTYSALMKFSSSGDYQWSKTYKVDNSTGSVFSSSKMSIDLNDKVYIASSLVSGFNSSGFSQYGIIKIDPKFELNDKNVTLYNASYFIFNKDGSGHYSYSSETSSQTETAGSLTSSDPGFTHSFSETLQQRFSNTSVSELINKKV